jgi:dihydroxyacid dehydratase/phosphogluconate dehydratase
MIFRAQPNALTGLFGSALTARTTKSEVSVSLDGFYPALEAGEIKPGMVLIFRYQGPKGAPGMPEVSYDISYLRADTERECFELKMLGTNTA